MADGGIENPKAANANKTNKPDKADKEQKKPQEPKQSVLETHGYIVGRSVGSGSYATVKVMIIFYTN